MSTTIMSRTDANNEDRVRIRVIGLKFCFLAYNVLMYDKTLVTVME